MTEWKLDKNNSDGIRTGFSMHQPNTTQYLSALRDFWKIEHEVMDYMNSMEFFKDGP